MQIVIDGKRLDTTEGETILVVARRAGIRIPTLCHHEALEGVGACRLCMVEITHPDWHGKRQLVTSCLYPVSPGLEVHTGNSAVRRVRQTVLDLLIARVPDSHVLQALSEENRFEPTEYRASQDQSKCIMCYRCVRACEAVGLCAIGATGRGGEKVIAPPFFKEAQDCVGCGSCAASCPTGHIEMTDTSTSRAIWGREFEFVRCSECNAPVMTAAYRDYVLIHRSLPAHYYTTCDVCRRNRMAAIFAKTGG